MTDVKTESLRLKDLNIRHDTIKFLEENISSNPTDIGLADNFFNLMLKAKAIKEKINEWDHIIPKSLCTAKDITSKMKT